ncbi:uncharacterized protein LOC133440768 [Cololabis saira]|uniref:uncharacterized protein LOC133440768 n=1 Tax=Cololabis saira TaxID=129043 RepID=UPI002AD4BCCB|nr:uncharacterized protein LOC133440768 [Cololabis saira]
MDLKPIRTFVSVLKLVVSQELDSVSPELLKIHQSKSSPFRCRHIFKRKISPVKQKDGHLDQTDSLDGSGVFSSNSPNNDPRYQYLGDKKGNCTLQIRDVQWKDGTGPGGSQDGSTFRFRMEADDPLGHFTNTTGVTVRVVDWIKLKIEASSNESRRGQSVSLQCTSSPCTIQDLNVIWFRDGHALSESGHALQLGPLTAEDSGKYTCVLSTDVNTRSDSFSLQVEDGDGDGDGPDGG